MASGINVGGTWKDITTASVNVGGTWKTVSNIHINVGGTWKEAWASGGAWTPASLFASSEEGVWFDPSDVDSMWQLATGANSSAAVDSPVAIIFDKSQGMELGAEIITNGTFDADSNWTKGTGWTISGGTANASSVGGNDLTQTGLSLSEYSVYRVEFTISNFTSGSVRPRFGGWVGAFVASDGTFVYYGMSATSATSFILDPSNLEGSIDNVSVKLVSGNHAYQATAAARPYLRQDGSGNYYLDFDGVDDVLPCTNADLGTDATIAYGLTTGASITGSQTIGANYSYSIDNTYGLVLIDRALTGGETASLTTYLDTKAGA